MASRTAGADRLLSRLARLVEREDPELVVYGTVAVGLVLAAEDPATETYVRVVTAVVVTVLLYWLAHAFAASLGERYATRRGPSREHVTASLRRELAVAEGAAPQVLVLVGCWILGASLQAAVTAALVTTIGVLAIFELIAGVRAKLDGLRIFGSALFGALLGVALLAVKALLH